MTNRMRNKAECQLPIATREEFDRDEKAMKSNCPCGDPTHCGTKEAMTPDQINKRFAELAGLYHYDEELKIGIYHISICNSDGPFDFCADPRLVIDAIKSKGQLTEFLYYIYKVIDLTNYPEDLETLVNLYQDTTGLLAMKAIAFLEAGI